MVSTGQWSGDTVGGISTSSSSAQAVKRFDADRLPARGKRGQSLAGCKGGATDRKRHPPSAGTGHTRTLVPPNRFNAHKSSIVASRLPYSSHYNRVAEGRVKALRKNAAIGKSGNFPGPESGQSSASVLRGQHTSGRIASKKRENRCVGTKR